MTSWCLVRRVAAVDRTAAAAPHYIRHRATDETVSCCIHPVVLPGRNAACRVRESGPLTPVARSGSQVNRWPRCRWRLVHQACHVSTRNNLTLIGCAAATDATETTAAEAEHPGIIRHIYTTTNSLDLQQLAWRRRDEAIVIKRTPRLTEPDSVGDVTARICRCRVLTVHGGRLKHVICYCATNRVNFDVKTSRTRACAAAGWCNSNHVNLLEGGNQQSEYSSWRSGGHHVVRWRYSHVTGACAGACITSAMSAVTDLILWLFNELQTTIQSKSSVSQSGRNYLLFEIRRCEKKVECCQLCSQAYHNYASSFFVLYVHEFRQCYFYVF